MCEKVKRYWEDLNVKTTVNKRELVLGAAVCTLAGLVMGMLLSPRTDLSVSPQLSIGSNNIVNEAPEDEAEAE